MDTHGSCRSLADCNVKILCETSVKEVTRNGLTVIDNAGIEQDIESDIVICTAGVQQSALLSLFPLTKDSYGRILTKDTLQTIEYDNVFAIGDCSAIQDMKLPSTAQVAMQQADVVSKNIVKRASLSPTSTSTTTLRDELSLESFKYVPLGEMLTLGYTDASITSLGGLLKLSGAPAAVARRLVYAARMPTISQSVNALIGAGIGTVGTILVDALERRVGNKK